MCFQTLQYLQQNAKERAELAASAAGSSTSGFSGPATASKISMQELEELRKQLGSVATGSTLQQVLHPPSMGHACWSRCGGGCVRAREERGRGGVAARSRWGPSCVGTAVLTHAAGQKHEALRHPHRLACSGLACPRHSCGSCPVYCESPFPSIRFSQFVS